jgi:hypothetical protein
MHWVSVVISNLKLYNIKMPAEYSSSIPNIESWQNLGLATDFPGVSHEDESGRLIFGLAQSRLQAHGTDEEYEAQSLQLKVARAYYGHLHGIVGPPPYVDSAVFNAAHLMK